MVCIEDIIKSKIKAIESMIPLKKGLRNSSHG
jgi:hypothetical protein